MYAEMSGVKEYPDGKPRDMQIDEDHASREGCNGIGGPVLQASFVRSLEAELNNRANISLNDLRECRIVLLAVFCSIRMIRWHESLRTYWVKQAIRSPICARAPVTEFMTSWLFPRSLHPQSAKLNLAYPPSSERLSCFPATLTARPGWFLPEKDGTICNHAGKDNHDQNGSIPIQS
jgi:hypothetical protein